MASTLQAPRQREAVDKSRAILERTGANAVAKRTEPEKDLRSASMPIRIAGAAIDAMLLLIVSGVMLSILGRTELGTTQIRFDPDTGEQWIVHSSAQPHWAMALLPFLLTALYTVVPMAVWGRTVGGWCLGIRCVAASGAKRPGLAVAVRRWALLYGAAGLIALVPMVGAFAWLITLVVGLSPLWDPTGRMQGYQDRWAGDRVVSTKRVA